MQKMDYSIEKILSNLKIEKLNDMQVASLEANKTGQDIVLLSATGSGKTLAFLLPLLKKLDKDLKKIQALIIVPTRELAIQIESVFKSLNTDLKVTCCYGGHLRETEENNLVEPPALLIGTPGRLADHLRRGNIQPDFIESLILDEYDKSVEFGFQEEISYIISKLQSLKSRILTSATESGNLPDYIGLTNPIFLNFLDGQSEAHLLTIQTLRSDGKDKLETLFQLVCFLGNRSMIIFCNHREAVERTSLSLKDKGIVNVFYHGAMEQQERDAALCKFRNGSANVLVTTDLASRGLDIPNIRYIIHYHLPGSEDIFLHRNGRTARMDASGTAIILLGPDEITPPYIPHDAQVLTLTQNLEIPDKPKWSTLFIAGGKKDKINKMDIVGFLSKRGELKKEDIGLIEVKDFFSFVAVRKSKIGNTLQLIKNEKIKNKKVRIEIAR